MNGHDIDRIVMDCVRALRANGENERADKLGEAFVAERAERDEARRLLDEARKQEPVAMVVHHNPPFGAVYKVEWYTKYRDLPNGTKLYAAPVPAQPAVPDDVAKDAETKAYKNALDAALAFIGDVAPGASWWDDVWAEHERAILSAAEGRSNG